jgi:hypothetical protein
MNFFGGPKDRSDHRAHNAGGLICPHAIGMCRQAIRTANPATSQGPMSWSFSHTHRAPIYPNMIGNCDSVRHTPEGIMSS